MTTTNRYRRSCKFAVRRISSELLLSSSENDKRAASALTAAALGSSCGEETYGLFGELFRKLEVRAMPRIGVEDQPRIR
ncbi:MAG: hypothetical protein QOJ51_3555 [Acidobacteriaceae bacterium]|jgi:hypothetical protein|nr:hypothetical protein [Acidobacteriaceae bacterium]